MRWVLIFAFVANHSFADMKTQWFSSWLKPEAAPVIRAQVDSQMMIRQIGINAGAPYLADQLYGISGAGKSKGSTEKLRIKACTSGEKDEFANTYFVKGIMSKYIVEKMEKTSHGNITVTFTEISRNGEVNIRQDIYVIENIDNRPRVTEHRDDRGDAKQFNNEYEFAAEIVKNFYNCRIADLRKTEQEEAAKNALKVPPMPPINPTKEASKTSI